MGFGNFRRLTHPLLPNGKCKLSEIISNRHYTIDSPYSIWRLYVRYRFSHCGDCRFLLHKRKPDLFKTSASKYGGSRNFYMLSASNAISFRAQTAWRTLSQLCLCNETALSPISRIARVMSIALTRSNLAAPSVITFAIGELVWSRRTLAHAENFLGKDPIYKPALDGHIYFTVFVLTLMEGIILLFRAVYLTILFLPCIAMAPFANSFGVKFRKSWLNVVHRTLEKAGPAFIKWGQWAATRPDLFPQDLCTELKELHTKAPAHSFALTKKTIENAFGRKLPEIFSKFEEEPVASGSVAQVHRATLRYKYPGREIKPIMVAVKVRHPSVGEAIRRDFMLINFVAKISRFIPTLNWLKLDESIQQFAGFMMSQVDLAREAAYLSRFIYNFRKSRDVSFPRPLYPLVHPAVLVETYEQGANVLHFVDELEGNEKMKSYLAHIGTHALLKMLLIDNFIHADMHPGNILVRLTDKTVTQKQLFGSRPHLVFLDVGMTVELSRRDRINLLEFFKAVAVQNGRNAAESTLKLSKHQTCPHPEAFIEEVEECFSSWNSKEGCFPSPAVCMQQLLEQVRRHKVNIDGNVCAVIVTTLVLEGWQRKLDPEYDVMNALKTLLFRADLADSFVYTIEGLMAP